MIEIWKYVSLKTIRAGISDSKSEDCGCRPTSPEVPLWLRLGLPVIPQQVDMGLNGGQRNSCRAAATINKQAIDRKIQKVS